VALVLLPEEWDLTHSATTIIMLRARLKIKRYWFLFIIIAWLIVGFIK
jgi:hypothetical protein